MRRALLLCVAACNQVASSRSDVDAGTAQPIVTDTSPPRATMTGDAGSNTAEDIWVGSYKSVAKDLYIAPELKGVHWTPTDTTTGLGDGTVELTVGPSGQVRGTLSAPLGPALLNGARIGDRVTATFSRAHPEDRGFVGTLDATLEQDRVEGQISASPAEAAAARVATFNLRRSAEKRATP